MRSPVYIGLLLALASPAASRADVPKTMNYQGVLTDAGGAPLTGKHLLTRSLYNAASGGVALWTEADSVTLSYGVFNVVLGQTTPLDLAFDQSYWLGVKIDDGAELTPRSPLTAAPYALRASVANSVASAPWVEGSGWVHYIPRFAEPDSLGNSVIYQDASGRVGIGTSAPAYELDVAGNLRVTGAITGFIANAQNADMVDGYHAGNALNNVPVSNGTLNTSLNADLLDGYHLADMLVPAHHAITIGANCAGSAKTYANKYQWIYITHTLKNGTAICNRYGLTCTEVIKCTASGGSGCLSWTTGYPCTTTPDVGRYWPSGSGAQNGDAYACCQ